MVQNIVDINERMDRVLNIVKAKFGLKNKSQAIELITKIYEESFLEPELRPEYIEKLQRIRKGKYSKTFSNVEELDTYIKSRDA